MLWNILLTKHNFSVKICVKKEKNLDKKQHLCYTNKWLNFFTAFVMELVDILVLGTSAPRACRFDSDRRQASNTRVDAFFEKISKRRKIRARRIYVRSET